MLGFPKTNERAAGHNIEAIVALINLDIKDLVR